MNLAIYTKPGCPYCDKIKQVFDSKNWNYAEYVLNKDFDKDAFYGQFGQDSTFPQVIMKDLKLGGCTESIMYFRAKGML
jgi:glutaredoxin